MRNCLDEIHELLEDFEAEVSSLRATWRQVKIDNPYFEEVSQKGMKNMPGCGFMEEPLLGIATGWSVG